MLFMPFEKDACSCRFSLYESLKRDKRRQELIKFFQIQASPIRCEGLPARCKSRELLPSSDWVPAVPQNTQSARRVSAWLLFDKKRFCSAIYWMIWKSHLLGSNSKCVFSGSWSLVPLTHAFDCFLLKRVKEGTFLWWNGCSSAIGTQMSVEMKGWCKI